MYLMLYLFRRLLFLSLVLLTISFSGIKKVGDKVEGDTDKYRVVYKGDSGPGVGKKIVFIASDHEYRSEESLPALARILAKRYGFTCTVVWALDEKGYIMPGRFKH